jgi:hypothetical protein
VLEDIGIDEGGILYSERETDYFLNDNEKEGLNDSKEKNYWLIMRKNQRQQ